MSPSSAGSLRLAQRRAEWLGARLAEQIEREGVGGAVGDSMAVTGDGAPVRVGEFARVLGELEARERATVARLAETVARLGIDVADRSAAVPLHTAVAWLEEFAAVAGLDWAEDSTRRLAQRAVPTVKQRQVSQAPS